MPLAAFAEPPHRTSGVDSTLLETLPPLRRGCFSCSWVRGSGVYFTRLGDYNRHQLLPYFKLPSVARVHSIAEFAHPQSINI
jgi:hypothetical protein